MTKKEKQFEKALHKEMKNLGALCEDAMGMFRDFMDVEYPNSIKKWFKSKFYYKPQKRWMGKDEFWNKFYKKKS